MCVGFSCMNKVMYVWFYNSWIWCGEVVLCKRILFEKDLILNVSECVLELPPWCGMWKHFYEIGWSQSIGCECDMRTVVLKDGQVIIIFLCCTGMFLARSGGHNSVIRDILLKMMFMKCSGPWLNSNWVGFGVWFDVGVFCVCSQVGRVSQIILPICFSQLVRNLCKVDLTLDSLSSGLVRDRQ